MKKNSVLILLCVLFITYCNYFLQNQLVFLDGQSIYYPVLTLLKTGSLNMGDYYNALYDTFYFKFIFSDTVFNVAGNNEIYPMQPALVIVYYTLYMLFFGVSSFFYINIFFAVGTGVFFYLIIKELFHHHTINTITLLFFMFLPTFLLYTTIPQTIIPTIFFLFASLFFLLKCINNQKDVYWGAAIVFFLWSCMIKPSIALFGLLFIPYVFSLRRVVIGLVVSFFVVGVFFLLNYHYFGDPLFIGYLHVNDRPWIQAFGIVSQPQYLSGYTSILNTIGGLLSTIATFFQGSFFVFSPTLLFSLLVGVGFKKRAYKENVMFFTLLVGVCIINVLYYSNMESQLWADARSEFSLSFSTVYFRYLTPVLLIMMIFLPLFLKKIGKISLFMIVFLSLPLVLLHPIRYTGGANLSYFQEIQKKRGDFANTIQSASLIPKGSVILFDERLVQYYLYPHVNEYHWFCYYCIPPGMRVQHTHQVLKKLIHDKKNIFFGSFGSPYNTFSQEMEDYLQDHFVLEMIEETRFEREKFIFYKVLDEKKHIDS